MQLTPRYGSDPVLVLDGPPDEIIGPTIRQRTRLATAVASFTDEQWAHRSRCSSWSNRDVIAHLESTNTYWAYSITAALRGKPTRLLTSFDPVTTPSDMVAGTRGLSPSDVLERFMASNTKLEELIGSLDGEACSAPAEAPPGHISISAVLHHALWDSWVHERDILLPLGIEPDEEADEIAPCLRYAAALGPAFALNEGATHRGVLAVDVKDPDVSFVVEIGDRVVVHSGEAAADLRLTGGAVDLLEALSVRQPLDEPIPTEVSWMVSGLSEAFAVEQA
jgi:uncharacterized protein (TIGR03083 family)